MSSYYLIIWSVAILVFCIIDTQAIVPSPRRSSNCQALSGKIYCYGGDSGLQETDSYLFMLDVSPGQSSPIVSRWVQITDAAGANIANDPRSSAQTSVSADGDQLIINGGFSYSTDTRVKNQTIAYSVSKNAWSVLDPFVDGINGNRQVFYGTSVYVPTKQAIYYFGGKTSYPDHMWYYDYAATENFTTTADSDLENSLAGFYRMTTLSVDVLTMTWTVIPNQGNFVTGYTREIQSAIFHPSSQIIYYFGGLLVNLRTANGSTSGQPSASFSDVLTFNTITNVWGNQTFTGTAPLKRLFHTTTLLPSNNDVLLYGGTTDLNSNSAATDFCYVADLETFSWRAAYEELVLPGDEPARRSEHSAVLISTKLYILFGYYTDTTSLTPSSVLVIDVSNPSKLSFISSSDGHSTGSSNNVGAIAGGVVGGVIAVLAIGIAAFCIRRKKRKAAQESAAATQGPDEKVLAEPIYVDWGVIDQQFASNPDPTKVLSPTSPSVPSSFPHSPNTVVADCAKYYPPNEIDNKTTTYSHSTTVDKSKTYYMSTSPALSNVTAEDTLITGAYSPTFRQSVPSTPDIPQQTRPDSLLISQRFPSLTKPDSTRL